MANLVGSQRFEWSVKTQPLVDNVIHQVFDPKIEDTEWLTPGHQLHYLDREHGIDVIAHTRIGAPITLQVKVLTQPYTTITIEETSSDGCGDFYTCKSQLTLVAYSIDDGESLARWALLNNFELALCADVLPWRQSTNVVSGLSRFRYIEFTDLWRLAPQTVVHSFGDWEPR